MKGSIAFTLLGLGLVVGGVFAYQAYVASNTEAPNVDVSDSMMQSAEKNKVEESTTTGQQYEITGGTASYIANKKFLGKPEALVTGTTSDVSGTGVWNSADSTISLQTIVNVTNIKTDSPARDKEVLELFEDKNINFLVTNAVVGVSEGQAFENEQVLGQLTINGISNEVVFTTSGMFSDTLNLKGTTEINLSDFNITPPSAVGVYTVDDKITLAFDVTGQRVGGAMMNETESNGTLMNKEGVEVEDSMMPVDPDKEMLQNQQTEPVGEY